MPRSVFVSIYNPADLFPPTLNAIECLASTSESIVVVTHSIEGVTSWRFPPRVEVIYAGHWPSGLNTSGHLKNLTRFLNFVNVFAKALSRRKYDLVLLYEPYAALAYTLTSWLMQNNKTQLWYHNHDIFELKSQGKLSIGRRAIQAEKNLISKLNVFSLPANERKRYFPMDELKGEYFFIPNYPSVGFYKNFYTPAVIPDSIRIIFQGRIAEGHGLEEIVSILQETIEGKELSLHLKGIVEEPYRHKILRLAEKYNQSGKLNFYGLTSYKEVPRLAASCHVGVAIHTKSDIMNSTLGTSSNKIYEYAAVGLPVLVYDNEHFRKHLGKYKWAFFTDCSKNSLVQCLKNILVNYLELSTAAYADFENELNFERHITPAIQYVDSKTGVINKTKNHLLPVNGHGR